MASTCHSVRNKPEVTIPRGNKHRRQNFPSRFFPALSLYGRPLCWRVSACWLVGLSLRLSQSSLSFLFSLERKAKLAAIPTGLLLCFLSAKIWVLFSFCSSRDICIDLVVYHTGSLTKRSINNSRSFFLITSLGILGFLFGSQRKGCQEIRMCMTQG